MCTAVQTGILGGSSVVAYKGGRYQAYHFLHSLHLRPPLIPAGVKPWDSYTTKQIILPLLSPRSSWLQPSPTALLVCASITRAGGKTTLAVFQTGVIHSVTAVSLV